MLRSCAGISYSHAEIIYYALIHAQLIYGDATISCTCRLLGCTISCTEQLDGCPNLCTDQLWDALIYAHIIYMETLISCTSHVLDALISCLSSAFDNKYVAKIEQILRRIEILKMASLRERGTAIIE